MAVAWLYAIFRDQDAAEQFRKGEGTSQDELFVVRATGQKSL